MSTGTGGTKRRWIYLPDLPLPTVDVDAHPRVGIFINREWKSALLSLVQHADQRLTWDSEDIDRIEWCGNELFRKIREARGMIGALVPYATETPPPGTLPCDGSDYYASDYPHLFDALPSSLKFTVIDEFLGFPVDKFRTPDFRGRFVLASTDAQLPYAEGGEEAHALTVEELAAHDHTTDPHSHTTQPHSHTYTSPTFGIDIESVGVPDPTGVGNPPLGMVTSVELVQVNDMTVTVNPTGEGAAHNNMPPFVAFNYAIVAL